MVVTGRTRFSVSHSIRNTNNALGFGQDLVVAMAVAVDPTEEVLDFLRVQQVAIFRRSTPL